MQHGYEFKVVPSYPNWIWNKGAMSFFLSDVHFMVKTCSISTGKVKEVKGAVDFRDLTEFQWDYSTGITTGEARNLPPHSRRTAFKVFPPLLPPAGKPSSWTATAWRSCVKC